MNTESLCIDFALNRGHEMVVGRERGIKRDELDEVEINMLQGRSIPKLLDIDWVDIDGRVTFRYLLKGKRMLMHRLQAQTITMADFYTVLLAVSEALDDSQHYMLRPEGFMLHEHYIFIGERWDDIGLAYIPLREKSASAPSAGEAVQLMAVRWIGYVEQPDGIGLQSVLQQLRADAVSWNGLRQTLLTQIGRTLPEAPSKTNPVPPYRPAYNDSGSLISSLQPQVLADGGNESKNDGADAPVADREYEQRLPGAAVMLSDDEAGGNSGRSRLVIYAGLIVALAAIWRFLYLTAPTRTSLLLCTGLSLMAAAGAFYSGRRSRFMNDHAAPSPKPEAEWNGPDGFVPNSALLGGMNKRLKSETLVGTASRLAAVPEDPEGSFPGHRQTGYEQSAALFGEGIRILRQTAFQARTAEQPPTDNPVSGSGPGERLAERRFTGFQRQEHTAGDYQVQSSPVSEERGQQDATVLLGEGGFLAEGEAGNGVPWLERESGERKARLPLEANRFVIGRSESGADYVDDYNGISRTHIELLADKEGGSWTVKDTGSRNGSTLNGAAMIPYKAYPLLNGDSFQLAGERGPKYVFRLGS